MRKPSLGLDEPPRPMPSGTMMKYWLASRGEPGANSSSASVGRRQLSTVPPVPCSNSTAFAMSPVALRLGGPKREVVELQLGQSLAGAETEIPEDEIPFALIGPCGLAPGGGGGGKEEKCGKDPKHGVSPWAPGSTAQWHGVVRRFHSIDDHA